MAVTFKFRRDDSANWSSVNPILEEGEIGIETDTYTFKIGNGIDDWDTLSYFVSETNVGQFLEDYILLADKGEPDGVATLDAFGQVPLSQLNNLINEAPALLDTLSELSAALGDDPNFATTITDLIGTTRTDLENSFSASIQTLSDDTILQISTAINNEATARDQAISDAIDQEVVDRDAAILVEATNRQTAIQAAIDQEVINRDGAIDIAVQAEADLRTAAITQEQLDRAAAIAVETSDRNTAIQTAIAQEVIDRNDAIAVETADREAAIGQEIIDRDQAITDAIAQEVIDRDAAIAVETAARITAVDAEASARATAIGAEELARIAADDQEVLDRNAAIDAAIATEVTDRTNAINALDSDLQGQIDTINTSLTAAESSITTHEDEITILQSGQTSLEAGVTTAQGDIVDLAADLSAETTARIAADEQEVLDRDEAIGLAIGAEITNRNTAINSAINTEVTNRNTAISAAIGQEVTDRTAAITSHSSTESAARIAGDSATLSSAQTYTGTLIGDGTVNGTTNNTVTDRIATAKSEAISTAASDATTKANTAEDNASTYADDLIGDATVDGTANNTVTARIASGVAAAISAADVALGEHEGLTTNVHGIADTSKLVTTNAASQTLDGNLTVAGDLIVSGTTTTVDTTNYKIRDNMIYLNQAGVFDITNAVGDGTNVVYTAPGHDLQVGYYVTVAGVDPVAYDINGSDNVTIDSVSGDDITVTWTGTGTYVSGGSIRGKSAANPDLGWAAGRYDEGYAHAGLFRDASDGTFKMFDGYTPEPDEDVFIDTTHASFALAPLAVSSLQAEGGVTFADGEQTQQGVPSITYIYGEANSNAKTATFNISEDAYRDKLIECAPVSNGIITVTIDAAEDYPIGTTFDILQTAPGTVTVFADEVNRFINATPGLTLREQWSSATLLKRTANSWIVYGDLMV